jgi:hypothetical protein
MAEGYQGKNRRTDIYTFTSKEQIIEFFSEFIPKERLEGLVEGLYKKELKDRGEGKRIHKLQKLKWVEWELDRYLQNMGTEYNVTEERIRREMNK